MNREIKFRAWDKVNKKMMNWVDQIHWANGAKIESVAQTTPLQSHKRWGEDIILMQFTGLKDKNGKEIYEGDYIEFIRDYNSASIPKRRKGEVFYNNNALAYYVNYGDNYSIPLKETLDYDIPIIIGNICETDL